MSSSPTSIYYEASPSLMIASQATLTTDTLDELQTPQQVKLLDIVDELRSRGLGHYNIDLPQLIVVGDQSSGKSSILEGLTRLHFPTASGTCTTFATELVLRKGSHISIECAIIPDGSRSGTEKKSLEKFREFFNSRENFDFQDVVEKAYIHMACGSVAKSKHIYSDALRIEYSGPDVPSLTIVDLPGLISAQFGGGDGARRVHELVRRYMHNKKSIILAVMQATNDPENQKVLEYLQESDPKRVRTLGIITKPDMLERGGYSEREAVALAKNETYFLQYGWHAVRNRGDATEDHLDVQRDETERLFFNTGPWTAVPRSNVGIAALRAKLSRILLEHISKELPSIVATVQETMNTTRASLTALGSARETSTEQRGYLIGHAEKFQSLTQDALRGEYRIRFFKPISSMEPTATRLRTEIQNLNLAFADIMYRRGRTWDIIDDLTHLLSADTRSAKVSKFDEKYQECCDEPLRIDRKEFLEQEVGPRVRNSRKAGLPGVVNPCVVGEIFQMQSEPWQMIAIYHLKRIFAAVKEYIKEALGSLMDRKTLSMLMLKHVEPELEFRWSAVEAKLVELLEPYMESDPISYDPSLIYELNETRAARYRCNSDPHVLSSGLSLGQVSDGVIPSSDSADQQLLTSIDDFSNSEVLDLVQTYYKRALTIFINNVTVLAIENCMIKDLNKIFSPSLIATMADEKIFAIASESEETMTQRHELQEKLDVLQSGKLVLHEYMALHPESCLSPPVERDLKNKPRAPIPVFKKDDETAGFTASPYVLPLTPPRSRSVSTQRSHSRVDSLISSPAPKSFTRRRSPLPTPPRETTPPADSDEEY